MSDKSAIEWTDATWNPVTGCSEVSPGCDHCYAKTMAERWRGTPGHYFENGFDVQLRPDKMALPLSWRKPRKVFVNSMSDLFHDDVPDEYIAEVFAVMAATPRHTFQLLTKRHGRMRSLLGSSDFKFRDTVWNALCELVGDRQAVELHPDTEMTWPLPNVWLGVSVENQQWADIRIPALLDTPAAVRWLSCEPLLGPVDLDGAVDAHGNRPRLTYWLTGRPDWTPAGVQRGGLLTESIEIGPRIDWVVVGGESGPGARPMRPAWARSLRNQCRMAGVPFLFKQWGAHAPRCKLALVGNRCACNGDNASHGEPEMVRVGKGVAGRELDGRTWDEFPVSVGGEG
jgi:protein gp37